MKFKILLFLIIGCFVYSCSDARLAQKHLKKAEQHGYKCESTSDTITISSIDSFPVIKHDSIVWVKYLTTKDTIIHYKTSYVPKTRWQTKIEYKTIPCTLR